MNILPTIQSNRETKLSTIHSNREAKTIQKSKSSRIVLISTSTNTPRNFIQSGKLTSFINPNNVEHQIENNYDYFNSKIPKTQIDKYLKTIKDEKFIFFINYGILRRYEGDCDIIYLEIPQIPKKLVVYRRVPYRLKCLDRLILNNKSLPHIPLFESENKLKYLSLELNYINKIDQLISLNNLLFLNLYGNQIKDIENLNGVKKLKVLLLGRNNIDKIKNLNGLTDLEILDLHNNKIRYVEGLKNLKKLRILNLSNNLICSFYELIYNKNLEELNVRKNLISVIPTISNGFFASLQKLNIGKNLLNKLQCLEELTKIKNLTEIILEYNPILNNPEAIVYINRLPIKGKVPILITSQNSNGCNKNLKSIKSSERLNKLGSVIFFRNKVDISSESNTQRLSRPENKMKFNENVKLTIKIITINKQWLEEYHDIMLDGYNGYNNKKFKETHIDQGYIEIDGENNNCLNLYGNCLKILMNEKLYNNINILKFNYFCFDFIMSKKFLKYLKLFKNIRQLYFNFNNIFSIYQLVKMECFNELENIQIYNNEICNSDGFIKYFLIYRIGGLKMINDEIIENEEKILSRHIFLFFDNIILQKEEEKERQIQNKKNKNANENKENNKNNDLIYNDNESDLIYQFWEYGKHNIESAIYLAINELEEKENN